MDRPLIEALLELETVARIGARTLGENSHMGSQLLDAVARVRRVVAPAALHQLATVYDPKIDLATIFVAAELAGLSWPDMRDALNRYNELATVRTA